MPSRDGDWILSLVFERFCISGSGGKVSESEFLSSRFYVSSAAAAAAAAS